VANIQHFINSTGESASVVLANVDANLLKNNISSVTKIDSFLKHFMTIKHALLDTETEEGHKVSHQRTWNDDTFEVEKKMCTAFSLCIVCSKNYFQYSKNCWLFIHSYLKHISQSIALYDQTIHSSKLKYQPE
jgi:hypothetical protein